MSQRTVVFLVTWAVAVLYLAARADRGWIPHDEGLLAQSAERVLLGELPHRDFDDPYTGGLAWLHALAFELFGTRLTSLRWTLLAFSAAFVAAVWAIAARVAPPLVAGAVTWTAVAWSLPLYFAALPSWYNLFFATFGTLALLRHLDDGRRRWLFAAGLCAGLSCLVKLVGLYFVAAVLLFLLYLAGASARPSLAYRLAAAGGALGLCAPVAWLVARTPGTMAIFHFLLPVVALGAVLVWGPHPRPLSRTPFTPARERGATAHPQDPRPFSGTSRNDLWTRLFRLVSPFATGVVLPVLFFLLPYVVTGSVGDLVHGIFVLPQKRFRFTHLPLPPPATLVTALPMAALLALPFFRRKPPAWPWTAAAALAAAVLLAFGGRDAVHQGVWHSVRPLVPLAVLAGCALVAARGGGWRLRSPPLKKEGPRGDFLLLAVAALTSLVQLPDAFALYFGYVAPLAALALAYVVMAQRSAPRALHGVALAFYLAFAVLWLHRSLPEAQGTRFWPVGHDATLAVERGGLRMPRRMAEAYAELVEVVRAHSAAGSFIYATPDAPEVYFLAGRRNPTRTFFDFFEDDFADPAARSRRILALLEERGVDLVVLKRGTQFSGEVPEALARAVAVRYPHLVERYPYTVRWRETHR